MTPQERLRYYAHNFETYGPDVTYWGVVPAPLRKLDALQKIYFVEKLREIADYIEKLENQGDNNEKDRSHV